MTNTTTAHLSIDARPFVVCPACAGHGFVSNIGDFTSTDLDEAYGDDLDAREDFVSEYTTRGGVYDRRCDVCAGNRVVKAECECEACEIEAENARIDAQVERFERMYC